MKTELSSLRPASGDTSTCNRISVKTTTLDDEIAESVTLIKLDIEGAEYNALLGGARILEHSKPIIVFENGRGVAAERFGYSKEDFFNLFKRFGYFLFSISGMPFTEGIVGEHLQSLAIYRNPSDIPADRESFLGYELLPLLRRRAAWIAIGERRRAAKVESQLARNGAREAERRSDRGRPAGS